MHEKGESHRDARWCQKRMSTSMSAGQWEFVPEGLVVLGNPKPTGHVDLKPSREDPRSFLERLSAGAEGRRVISLAEVQEMLAPRKLRSFARPSHMISRSFNMFN